MGLQDLSSVSPTTKAMRTCLRWIQNNGCLRLRRGLTKRAYKDTESI